MSGPAGLILASASPRRSQLMREAGHAFDVLVAQAEEWDDPAADPRELVLHNARLKGDAIAALHPGRPVLSADTTVALEGHVLNKPADMADARRMLLRLAGRKHTVYTAVVLQHRAAAYIQEACVESRVAFRPLDDAAIDRYFTIVNPLDKAGAYGIQEGREIIIDHFEGSLSNIMGLPMDTVREMFEHYSTSRVSGLS